MSRHLAGLSVLERSCLGWNTHTPCLSYIIHSIFCHLLHFLKITKDTSWEVRQFLSSNFQSIDIESFALGAEQNNWLKLVLLMNSDAIQRRDLWAQPHICPWCTLALTFHLVRLTPMAHIRERKAVKFQKIPWGHLVFMKPS